MNCKITREMAEKRCLKNMEEALKFFGQKAAECCSCPCETGLRLKGDKPKEDNGGLGESGLCRPSRKRKAERPVGSNPTPAARIERGPRQRYISFAGAKDAQGETNASHTSRPGTAGDKRADRKPPISSGRLDQDRPGGVPHTEREEGRLTPVNSAPQPVPPQRRCKVKRTLTTLLSSEPKRKPGRPRKSIQQAQPPKKKRGRPPGCICPKCRVVVCELRKVCGRRHYRSGPVCWICGKQGRVAA
jgi:hypothetical protein